MVAFFKRPAAEDGLDARIALLSRRTQPLADPPDPALGPLAPATPDNKRAMPEITRAAVPNIAFVAVPETGPAAPPQPVPTAVSPNLSEEDRFLLAREELFARLTAELSPERISILSRGELAKVVDAAVQAHFVRNGVEPDRGRRGKGHGEPFRDAFGWAAASYHYTANSLRNAASIGRSAADVI
jgi:hypothetical protein